MGKLIEERSLNTEWCTISLGQLQDIQILEWINRYTSVKNGLKGKTFDKFSDGEDCIIIGILIKDSLAVIQVDNGDQRIIPINLLNIDIGFDFLM